MRKKLSVVGVTAFLFIFVSVVQAKLWTKELVDRVTLDSGYRFQMCVVNGIGTAEQILSENGLSTVEESFAENTNKGECTGDKEELLFGNTSLVFNQETYPGVESLSEQLIVFRDKVYSIQGSGSDASYLENGKTGYDLTPIKGKDFFGTVPRLKAVKRVGLGPTDPKDFDDTKVDNTKKDSAITIFHDKEGKFTTFLFVYDGLVFKMVALAKEVTEPTLLVDYPKGLLPTKP